MRLDATTVAEYLRDSGVVPGDAEMTIEPLGGGVSNDVFRVDWRDDAVVVKQPLPNLAVADDWPADVERVHNEAAAARIYADVIASRETGRLSVPAVRFEDHDAHVVVISAAPRSARPWKSDLLDGVVDARVAAAVGEFLAAAHDYAAGDATVAAEFDNDAPFEQLRLDPYHRTVAKRHPDLAAVVEREIERVGATRSTLVHGDYSPKNVLVDEPNGEPTLWLLDFEVAHWGDPAFDVAFMCNHLFIKSVYRSERRDDFLAAVDAFWNAYADAVEAVAVAESSVVTELGILLLARVDGKSPVEYVERRETKERLRHLGRWILEENVAQLSAVRAAVQSEVDSS